MSDQFRIVQKGQNEYTVQEKGWFFWSQASYTTVGMYGDMGRLHFISKEAAKEWIKETIELRRQRQEREAFKSKVVWPK